MKFHYTSSKGSVLLTAMLFSVAMAMAVAGYFAVAIQSAKISNRSVQSIAALNVAETGLEEALWAINQRVAGSTTSFTAAGSIGSFSSYNWSTSGSEAIGTFNLTSASLGQNASGVVKVYVQNYDGAAAAPTIVSHAIVTLGDGSSVNRWIKVRLDKRSYFAMGLVAKESLKFNGTNPSVDSWNSGWSSTSTGGSIIGYSSSAAHDYGTIGAVEVTSTITVQNADIWGYASVGGSSASAISVGPQGRVGPYGTALGTKDPSHINTNFTANLDPVAQPDGSPTMEITDNMTLNGDTSSDTSVYTTYYVSDVALTNKTLTINGRVKLVITASAGQSAIDIGGGSGALNVNSMTKTTSGSWIDNGTRLQIYTAGDIKIAGNGVSNGATDSSTGQFISGIPAALQIYGTSTSTTLQSIDIKGNGTLSGVVYAPNADVAISGGGSGSENTDVYGSIVGDKITVSGNTAFHYDEALGSFGGGNPYGIVEWRELTSATDRDAYSSKI